MITFKQYLIESTIDFDMTDLSKKEEGRIKLAKLSGLSLEEARPYFRKATDSNVVAAYNEFVSKFPHSAAAMNNAKGDGIGPGEVIFYFLFDNVGVGGKNSPIDLFKDGKPWAEAKAGPVTGGNSINNFKITKDGSPVVSQLMSDLEAFNKKYGEITGEDLPGWRTAGTLSTVTLRGWRDIDLEKMAKESTGGPKKAIDLTLKKDGDLLRKGDEEPITNVKSSKSTKPIADLISGEGKVSLTKDEKEVSTLEKIISRWVDGVFEEYLSGKKIALIDNRSKGTKLAFFGTLKKEQLSLYITHRNQPWAEVYLTGERPTLGGPKGDSKPAKGKEESGEDLGRALKAAAKKK